MSFLLEIKALVKYFLITQQVHARNEEYYQTVLKLFKINTDMH